MTKRALIHPRMMTALVNHFPQQCSIGHETIGQNPDSGEEETTYPIDPGLTNIDCALEPQRGAGSGEIRRPDQTIVENPYVIALRGYYPTIDQEDHAVIDGLAYNILFVRHDATHTITFLDVERVNDGQNT